MSPSPSLLARKLLLDIHCGSTYPCLVAQICLSHHSGGQTPPLHKQVKSALEKCLCFRQDTSFRFELLCSMDSGHGLCVFCSGGYEEIRSLFFPPNNCLFHFKVSTVEDLWDSFISNPTKHTQNCVFSYAAASGGLGRGAGGCGVFIQRGSFPAGIGQDSVSAPHLYQLLGCGLPLPSYSLSSSFWSLKLKTNKTKDILFVCFLQGIRARLYLFFASQI